MDPEPVVAADTETALVPGGVPPPVLPPHEESKVNSVKTALTAIGAIIRLAVFRRPNMISIIPAHGKIRE